MKPDEIRRFTMRYLEAEGCQIIERSPAHALVKFSPAADKALTGRPFYWNFVERTGAPAETMTFLFVFDPERYAADTAQPPAADGQDPAAPPAQQDTILGRYFGYVPPAAMGRLPREDMAFGSRKLEQIFMTVREKGRFVRLFEEPRMPPKGPPPHAGYTTWFHVNYKVELACDMKRDELHSLGIDLITGDIVEDFYEGIKERKLSPQLPANVHLQPPKCTLQRAWMLLDSYLEQKVGQYDHTWAHEASLRLQDELELISGYYAELLQTPEEEKRREAEAHYQRRREELEWQYAPRIGISVINCGLFHLPPASRPRV